MNIQFNVRTGRYGRVAGFTLIELMITVAIVAILAALAYPSYRNYVLRGQLVYATNALSALSANMERYYQDNRTYTSTNGLSTPCPTQAQPIIAGTFNVYCPNAPVASTPTVPSSYQAAAVGAGPTLGFTFTVNQIPVQATSIVAPAPSVWIINCPNSWVSKEGSC